jgi:pyrroloquinoline quinone biosynthesis protein B
MPPTLNQFSTQQIAVNTVRGGFYFFVHCIVVWVLSIEVAISQEAKPETRELSTTTPSPTKQADLPKQPFAVLLGNAQDAGYPQAGCQKECCRDAWDDPARRRFASCLAIVDPISKERFMLECTPDFKDQLRLLEEMTWVSPLRLNKLLITHAHIGHYAGLIHLGREVMGIQGIPVHVMPRMEKFLKTNGPWSQLVELKNIELKPLAADQNVRLNERISVTPILVPHRGEFSETVAFIVEGVEKKLLFLPDIDRWEDWDRSIEDVIKSVDYALLDGTFLADGELPGRDMSSIPHPTIQLSIQRFSRLQPEHRQKIFFIHLNHTNPLVRDDCEHPMREILKESGMSVGSQGQVFLLGN